VHIDNRYLAVWVRENGRWKFVDSPRRSSTAMFGNAAQHVLVVLNSIETGAQKSWAAA
jgi:hypothetical protein